MRSLRGLRQWMRWLQPRGPIVPTACYDTCNNASLEAQGQGKNPELCAPGSTFLSYYNACTDCVNTLSSNNDTATQDYLEPAFSQWIAYCDLLISATSTGLPPTSTESPSPTSTSSAPPAPISSASPASTTGVTPKELSDHPYAALVTTIAYTVNTNGLNTVFSLETTITSFASLPETTVTIMIETSENGHETVWSFTKTFTALSRESVTTMTSAPPDAPETSTPNPIDTPEPEDTQRSLVWIAGPIIGGVAGVVIILAATWLLLRVKRRRRRGYEVHGDSAFKSELEVQPQPQELDAQGQSQRPAELPGNAL